MSTSRTPRDPREILDRLGAIWSDDLGAYASGQLDASQVHCALCMCAPCRCPAFGTPAYVALVDFRHGRARQAGQPVRIDILRPIPGDRDQSWSVDCRTCGVVISRHRSESAARLARTGHLDRSHAGAEPATLP